MRSKDKNIFKSHVTSSNNIATFNCFAKLYNDESSNDVTEQNNQNNVIVTFLRKTTTANVRGVTKKTSCTNKPLPRKSVCIY